MKISIVFPVLNQHPLADLAISSALHNMSSPQSDIELIIVDNGSDTSFAPSYLDPARQLVIRHERSIGVYPVFWDVLPHVRGDIVAFFHSDLIINEKGWDERVRVAFSNKNVGLVGFVGSNEIDASGGRGLGTTSNFKGMHYTHNGDGKPHEWTGSAARFHGKESSAYSKAAVVDGCAMIFRTSVLKLIDQRKDFPPHHFYDRLLSCEVREHGYEVGVLGIGCDHISGQTVNAEPLYKSMAQEWAEANLPMDQWRGYPGNWSWDETVYAAAERKWLLEYREQKHFIPCRV